MTDRDPLRLRRHTPGLAFVLLCGMVLLGNVTPAAGEEDEEALKPSPLVTSTVSLHGFRLPPPVRGANLASPADLLARGFDGPAERWNQDPGDERIPWIPFAEADAERRLFVHPEQMSELLMSSSPPLMELYETVEGAGLFARGDQETLHVALPREAMPAFQQLTSHAMRALRPTAIASARLVRTSPERSLRAVGTAELWPGRWTALYLQKEETPCVVGYDVHIAQDAAGLDPMVRNLVEGHELYLRCHPGEEQSLVEVWAGDLEHLDMTTMDLHAAQGTLRLPAVPRIALPTTRVRRCVTTLVIPNGKRVTRSIRWKRGDDEHQLHLVLDGPAVTPGVLYRSETQMTQVFRVGAEAGALEFGLRASSGEELIEELMTKWFHAHGDDGQGEPEMAVLEGGELLVARMQPSWAPVVSEFLRKRQSALKSTDLDLRMLRLPEGSLRELIERGALRVGSLVTQEMLTEMQQEAHAEAVIVLPVTEGLGAGFRLGESVPGVIDLTVEVAEKAAAYAPVSWSVFSGLFGDVRLRRTREGLAVRLHGEWAWADQGAGSLELDLGGSAAGPERVPLLSGGSDTFDIEITKAPGVRAAHVAHLFVRGAEGYALLVR